MPFPTVKSSPWGKPRRRRKRAGLWPDSCWKQLVEQAKKDHEKLGIGSIGVISPACLALIAEFNEAADQSP
jgi:hypothetical protein